MEAEQIQTKVMTPADAYKFIKNQRGKNMSIFIYARQQAPIYGTYDKCFPISGNVKVTRVAAMKFIKDHYTEGLAARGAMVEIQTLGRCIFIGG